MEAWGEAWEEVWVEAEDQVWDVAEEEAWDEAAAVVTDSAKETGCARNPGQHFCGWLWLFVHCLYEYYILYIMHV